MAFFVEKLALRGLVAAEPEGLRLHPALRGRYAAALGLGGRVLPMLEALNADEVRVIARNPGAKVIGLCKGPLIELTVALLSDGSRPGPCALPYPQNCREPAEQIRDALIGTGRRDGYAQYETLRRTPSPRRFLEGWPSGGCGSAASPRWRSPASADAPCGGSVPACGGLRAPFPPTALTPASAPRQMARGRGRPPRRVDDALPTAVVAPASSGTTPPAGEPGSCASLPAPTVSAFCMR